MLNVRNMRKDILIMGKAAKANGAHFGGSFSLVEIMAVLYGGGMRFDPADMVREKRDRLILSKGHGVLAQYAALAQLGIIGHEDLLNYKTDSSKLSAHPAVNTQFAFDFASGSLGQGLSLGVGAALALAKKQDMHTRVFVILGDGECDEGQVWEAAMSAGHYGLSNLVAIVDKNQLQYDGPTRNILDLCDLAAKWKSFGWETRVVDGHDENAISQALLPADAPLCVIANTIKGKGISFMENAPEWHNGALSQKLFDQAMMELENDNARV